MTFKKYVEDAFGTDAEERVPVFLQEKELPDCGDDTERWYGLYKKCEQWRKEFLLWEEDTYVYGVHGWNLSIHVCRLRLPEEPVDWAVYLYRMTALVIVDMMDADTRRIVADAGREMENFLFCLSKNFYVEFGYWSLTRTQWLEEIANLLEKSKERHYGRLRETPKYRKSEYYKVMKINYPKFQSVLNYLAKNVGDCEVVRMNQHGSDEAVWYFVKAWDCFYLMYLSDSM